VNIFAVIAERRILEAMQQGAFDDLPGRGRPLVPEALGGVPEELRMAYKVLKNAGYLPPELQLQQEIVSLRELFANCTDADERVALRRRLSEKQLRYRIYTERHGHNPTLAGYRQKLEDRVGS